MTTITNTQTDSPWGSMGLATQAPQRGGALGQADFLRLMTEQLKNQDPLKPLANTEFLGQLAQFSTVQGIEEMQSAMGAMASVMESDQTLRAAALVGRDALVAVDAVDLQAGVGLQGEVAARSAGPVSIEITDASGATVRRMSVQAGTAGATAWQWDGLGDNGQPAPAGRYAVKATAGSEGLDVRLAARVDSVSIEATGLVLNLSGLGSHPLSAIRRLG